MNGLNGYKIFRSEIVAFQTEVGNLLTRMDAVMENESLSMTAKTNSLTSILDEFENLK